MDNWRFPVGCGDIRNVDVSQVRVTRIAESGDAPLIPINLGVRDLLIEDFQRLGDDASPAPTLVIENRARNTLRLSPVSQDDLQLTESAPGSLESDTQAFATPDGTLIHQAIMQMGDGDRLVLARGGIRRLALNRETKGEQEGST